MKKFFVWFAGTLFILLVLIYLAFLFYLPVAINLNEYIPMFRKIVKEQTNADLYISDAKISTSPLLQAGVKTGKVTIKLPDGSVLLDTEGIKARVSIPNLLFLKLKVSCLEIDSPFVNMEIVNGEQYKLIHLIEDILNKKKDEPIKESKPLPIDINSIKIVVPHAVLSNYKVVVKDLKTSHSLTLKGDELVGGYFNRETAKLKTNAEILSDDNTNIVANLELDSYLPPKREKDLDDDPAEKIELPFVNPVLVYRDYDLKSNVNAKLKLRKTENGRPVLKGYADIIDTTVNLSGLQLPPSSVNSKFKGDEADLNANIVVAQNQKINFSGKLNYGKDPNINFNIFTDKIYFNDMVIIARAFLDTLHIKNNLAYIKANGYWVARGKVLSDFKTIKSDGCIIARDGRVYNGFTNLVFDKINANVILKDDTIKIVDTHTFINGNILKAEGVIDTDSFSDISVYSEKLPLPGLYKAFAPSDLKKSLSLSSGSLSLDAKVKGKLKQPIALANVMINNLVLHNNSLNISNEKLIAGIVTDLKTIDGSVTNKNFSLKIPKVDSVVKSPLLSVKLNEQNININPADILVNDNSKIVISGNLLDYSSSPVIKLDADGFLNSVDLRKFAGKSAIPFIEAKGNIPIKALISGTDKKQSFILQMKADSANFVTPVEIQSMRGLQTILQAKIDRKPDKIHIKQTGFYTGVKSFTNNFENNLTGAKKIAEFNGTIIHMNSAQPFINVIKLDVPNSLIGRFTAFKNSHFKFDGGMLLFGKLSSPVMKGKIRLSDLQIPEILTSMNQADINLSGKNIILDIRKLLLNGSDVNIVARTDIEQHPVFTISRLDLNSKFIDVDKILKVPNLLSKYTISGDSKTDKIPVLLRTGSLNIREIKSGDIKAGNTTGDISLKDNVLFLDNLNTTVFSGNVKGNIAVDLISQLIDIKTNGEAIDVKDALFVLAGMKDMLTGTLNFNTDINFSGSAPEEIMKNLKGEVKFVINDGQMGPFGKLENMILAENIRESKFFQTALGGVINNIASIDTSRFKTMDGLIKFDNGIAHITPITTLGSVMSLRVAGDYDLLKNTADLKVRAKLGSVIANLLGPLAQLNPINLIQATPGLNVVMAKAFFLFCEQLTPEETALLPKLENPTDDKLATKFQIVLRGDVAKPLTLIKSFKWLALASEIEKAEGFVSTLPDPSIVEDSENATLENIMKAQEEKAKEDAKLKNKLVRFFKKNKVEEN